MAVTVVVVIVVGVVALVGDVTVLWSVAGNVNGSARLSGTVLELDAAVGWETSTVDFGGGAHVAELDFAVEEGVESRAEMGLSLIGTPVIGVVMLVVAGTFALVALTVEVLVVAGTFALVTLTTEVLAVAGTFSLVTLTTEVLVELDDDVSVTVDPPPHTQHADSAAT